MSDRNWYGGAPPFIGWWNASVATTEGSWRWWNGQRWSMACTKHVSTEYIANIETMWGPKLSCVRWSDFYPEDAVVPRRIDDRDKTTLAYKYASIGEAYSYYRIWHKYSESGEPIMTKAAYDYLSNFIKHNQ